MVKHPHGFNGWKKSGAINSWEDFLREVQKRFGPSLYEDPLGRISKLIHRDTVARFGSEFEELMRIETKNFVDEFQQQPCHSAISSNREIATTREMAVTSGMA